MSTLVIDHTAAEEALEEALQRVDSAADPAWKALADQTIEDVARKQEFLHGDDIWAAGLPRVRENRALGPAFRRAAARGIIVWVGYTKSAVAADHSNPHGLWRSTIFQRSV